MDGSIRMSGPSRGGLAALWVLLALGVAGAPYPEQMYLQHIPTVAALIAWPYVYRTRLLSGASGLCIAAFVVLHIVGARYIYSYVPYDAWTGAVFGRSVGEVFGFTRNHYDRVVHFGYGLLFTRPAFDVITRRTSMSRTGARYFSVEFVVASSAVYELFEWLLTLLLSGADAEAYNGQQGDMWDAHKDMAFASLGSLLAVFALPRRPKDAAPT